MSKQVFILNAASGREHVAENACAFIRKLPAGKAFRVEIAPHSTRRSDQQNRYLWGVCYATICQRLDGWDAEDVHEYMLGECYGWETCDLFGRKKIRPIRRSSRLSKAEFAEFVDFIHRKAAEHCINIPEANFAADAA